MYVQMHSMLCNDIPDEVCVKFNENQNVLVDFNNTTVNKYHKTIINGKGNQRKKDASNNENIFQKKNGGKMKC